MVELTFLELHFHDSDLSAQYGPGEKDVTVSEEADATEEPSGSNRGKAFAALVGLVFLAAVAYVVKQRGPDEAESEATGPTEIVERLRR